MKRLLLTLQMRWCLKFHRGNHEHYAVNYDRKFCRCTKCGCHFSLPRRT